jgi:vacuolar protein sorting-associated protein VTA1
MCSATAKQFLAASHFLEVLNVFDKAVREDSVREIIIVSPSSSLTSFQYEDKIKYAKWKAADIAKAFREGRQPTPGPAGGLEQEAEDALAASTLTAPPDSLPGVTSSTPGSSRPSIVDDTDTWSTPATPRVPHVDDFQSVSPPPPPLNSYESEPGWRPIIENEQLQPAQARAPVGRSDSTAAIVDGDTSATDLPHASSNAQALGISSEDDLTQALPTAPGSDSAEQVEHVSTHDSIASQIPPSSTPSIAPTVGGTPSQPTFSLPPGFVPTSTPIPGTLNLPAAVVPPPPILHVQQPLVALTAPLVVAEAIKPSPKLPPPELTPKLIAAIQRHCKFAISALDYEDPETARMQLRSALDMLGG